jgi:uncharacterized membrane protein YczE
MTHLGPRLVRLYAGLLLYALSMALFLRANLGGMPWDVLHQGITVHTGLPMGVVVLGAGVVVMLLWIPLRQRPGIGTVSNIVVISLAIDPALQLVPEPTGLPSRIALLTAGVLTNAVATAMYLAADFGPGPRDGLMTGLVRRTGGSVRLIKTSIEVSVVTLGWLLGGVVGVGTVIYALAMGPLVQVIMPLFERRGQAGWREGSAATVATGVSGSAAAPQMSAASAAVVPATT